MFRSIFRALPTRVSGYLTASYFTGGFDIVITVHELASASHEVYVQSSVTDKRTEINISLYKLKKQTIHHKMLFFMLHQNKH